MADATPRPYYPPPPGGYVTPRPVRRSTWVIVLSVAALLAVLLIAAGVGMYRIFQRSGQAEIVPLHDEMKRMDTEAIYDNADPAYRISVSRARSDSYFQSVHNALGDPLRYSVAGSHLRSSTTGGTVRTLVLRTHFTRGDATELLRFRKTAGQWRLLSYGCSSPLLKQARPSTVAPPPRP